MPGNREFFQLRSTTPRMAAGSDEAELMLYGEIVPDYSKWYKENYPEDKSAADFDKAVKQIKQNGARRLNLRINSPGGIVTQAVAMRAILSGAGFERINMRIEGMCASAATIIASLPGAHVEITPGSEYMIHNPWNIIIGTAADMEHEAEHLRALEATSRGFYINRTGQEEEQVKAWMDAETWFNAEDAVKYGFVDAVAQENGGTDLAAACVTGREMAVMRKLYKAIPEQIEVRQDGGKVEAGGVFIEREDGQEIILPPEYTKKVHDLIQQLVSNEAPVAGVSTEIHHHEEENKSMENQENMSTEIKAINVDQLRAENPALYDSIRQSAISEERQRIEEIDDLTMPGYETMAEKAKADGISAMEFHRQIVQAQKQKGASFIENRKRETTPEKPVHGGDASDNNANAQATSDAMAKELAEMADGMFVNVKGMY